MIPTGRNHIPVSILEGKESSWSRNLLHSITCTPVTVWSHCCWRAAFSLSSNRLLAEEHHEGLWSCDLRRPLHSVTTGDFASDSQRKTSFELLFPKQELNFKLLNSVFPWRKVFKHRTLSFLFSTAALPKLFFLQTHIHPAAHTAKASICVPLPALPSGQGTAGISAGSRIYGLDVNVSLLIT